MLAFQSAYLPVDYVGQDLVILLFLISESFEQRMFVQMQNHPIVQILHVRDCVNQT